jgi:YD repeat-containing protein
MALLSPNDITTIPQRNYTIYSYDVHGNVKWLCQYIAVSNAATPNAVLFKPKFIDYQYDLVSGKVLSVAYNKGQPDQFFHRYTYDAQNRLVYTETSNDQILWDKDATYTYYPHGPLRRTEIGDDHLQGLDYTYTAQGWLKAFNSPMLTDNPSTTPPTDPYLDGITTPTARASMFPPDTYGMQLHYFTDDFTNGSSNVSPIEQTDAATTALNSLYNGNIAAWTERGIQPDFTAPATGIELDQTLQYRYRYDLLNRIKGNETYSVAVTGSNYATSTVGSAYKTSYTFDRNGNVTYLKRRNDTGTLIDNFAYDYPDANIGDETRTNRLTTLNDTGSGTGNDNFIGNTNYTYDAIGNVTKETNNGAITEMTWTPYGKISTVTTPTNTLTFAYDAAQNRIRQDETIGTSTTSTLYVRDAQGNPMAMYKQTPLATSTLTQLTEQPIYGSSRLGIQNSNLTVQGFLPVVAGATSLAPPNPPTYLPETTHLLFGLVPTLIPNESNHYSHELMGFMDSPSPVFLPWPTNNSVSFPTGNQTNIGLAENTNGNIAFTNVLSNATNNITGYNDNSQLAYTTATGGYEPTAQNVGVPVYNTTTYAFFTIKGGQLYYFVKDLNNIAIPVPAIVNVPGNSNLDKTLAVMADYKDANSPKIYVFLRKQTGTGAPASAGSYNTQIVRVTINPANIGTGTANNIGTSFPSYTNNSDKYYNTLSEIQLSPDGNYLATPNTIERTDALTYKSEVRIYNLSPPNTYISSPIVDNTFIRSIDFSPTGQYIYAIGRKNGIEKTYRIKASSPTGNFAVVNTPTAAANWPSSSVRRGKNGNMYVAYAGQTATTDQILEIANPDQASP